MADGYAEDMQFLKNLSNRKGMRELLMMGLDLFILTASYAALLVLNLYGEHRLPTDSLGNHLILLGICISAFLIVFRTYKSLWAYAESREYLSLIGAAFAGYAVYLLVAYWLPPRPPFTLTLLAAVFPLLVMLAVRFAYRRYREYLIQSHLREGIPLLIIGAGDAGVMLLDEMLRNIGSGYRPVCLLDDDPNKMGRRIRGIPIEGPISNLETYMKKYGAREILVAIPSASKERSREILELCMPLKCRVRLLPDVLTLMSGPADSMIKKIREVSIEDLLGREPVDFENQEIYHFLSDKVVMVTGGGGSIGSELCRQIARQNPRQLIVLDIYENNAYDIQQELKFDHPSLNLSVEIASVRDERKIDRLFERYRPQIVFHAAAHKHVPLMEDCPEEAVRNNVFGTYHVAKAAQKYHAERFILISTDKAVNPTNVMGATKRLCEMIVQSMASSGSTRYAAVRFGNVLGSNGSVIPLFQRQIRHGGPVTVTDKRIIRYFMTIPEAAQLVLQAGAMANDSEIVVLDMGSPVSILELAENLIRLSGYTPYVDMPIVETGLRPGEKLYEELLMRNENLVATPNHKIFIERQREPITPQLLEEKLKILDDVLSADSPSQLIATMKRLIPTYKSPEEVNAAKMADLNYSHISRGETTTV